MAQIDAELAIAKKFGLQLFGKNYPPNTTECNNQHDNMKQLVKLIKKRINSHSKVNSVMETNISANVAVMGSPYKFRDKISIYAESMQVDNEKSRSIEINFKRNLAQWYRDQYGKYSRDGTIKYN